MSRFNNGIIYTNENCIGCNRCISACSILGANVSVKNNGRYVIQVDSRKCSTCGNCISVCSHNARKFDDDTDEFIASLNSGKRRSLIVDASFFAVYGPLAGKILGFLKSMGVDKFYSTNLGKEIAIWRNVNYVKEHSNDEPYRRGYLVNNCSAMVTYLERFNTELMEKIIPVHSDVMCTAIYARKYLNDTNDFAYLGACTSKKDDFENHDTEGLIKSTLIYSKFIKSIYDCIENSPEEEIDFTSLGLDKLAPIVDQNEITYSFFFPQWETVKTYSGISEGAIESMELECHTDTLELRPVIADMRACADGCGSGPGNDETVLNRKNINLYNNKRMKASFFNYRNRNDYENNLIQMNELFEYLNPKDFDCKIIDRYHQTRLVPEETLDIIYSIMKKDTDQKRHINCGSCGYANCKEMATAIACGYNKKENCIHYMNEEMQRQYSLDVQTDILNRHSFIKNAKELLNNNPDKRYAIASGDINRFKIINQLYGSAVGDKVLRRIAEYFSRIVGKTGLCARASGGNFLLCIENTVENLTELRKVKEFDCKDLGVDFPITMRFGLYITKSEKEVVNRDTNEDLIQEETLLEVGVIEADVTDDNIVEYMNFAAMARDKITTTVQNQFFFFSDNLKDTLESEAYITRQIKKALENDEFKLWFQPQYDTNTGRLIGAEALCRWVKKDGTIICPGEFIPVAEKNGFIKKLDEHIWYKAFVTVRKWLDQGLNPVPISVNISRVSLESDSLLSAIQHYLDITKVPTNLIHFEITESAYMADVNQSYVISRISSLRSMGFAIAMDDFGSGYSSLNSLKDLPIDILKLDMGFLKTGDMNSASSAKKGENIIGSIVRMAKKIAVTTIAEGVETEKQASFLKSVGSDIIQGYVYSRPVNETDFLSKLSASPKNHEAADYEKFYRKERKSLLKTADRVLFEKYSGPLAVYSYDEMTGDVQLERFNADLLELFELKRLPMTVAYQEISDVILTHLDKNLFAAVRSASESNEEVERVVGNVKKHSGAFCWIKENICEIERSGNVHTIYIRFDDVTDEKIAEYMYAMTLDQKKIFDEENFVMCVSTLEFDPKHVRDSMNIRVVEASEGFAEMFGGKGNTSVAFKASDLGAVISSKFNRDFLRKALVSLNSNYQAVYSDVCDLKTGENQFGRFNINITGIWRNKNTYLLITTFTQHKEI